MVVENIINVPAEVLIELGRIGLILNALGIIIVLWIIFQVISLIVNRKRRRALYRIEDRLKVIESKINKLTRKPN